jgi:hypothetical protein
MLNFKEGWNFGPFFKCFHPVMAARLAPFHLTEKNHEFGATFRQQQIDVARKMGPAAGHFRSKKRTKE